MIAATLCIKGDADIVPLTARNMLDQGIDHIYAYATGDNPLLGMLSGLTVLENHDDQFHQAQLMDELAQLAGDDGAEFVVPFDADEFWFGLDGRTVADTLRAMPRSIGKVWATLWHHQTRDEKVVPAERLHKVAYRWTPGASIHPGNHDVDLPAAAEQGALPGLQIRHFQYRSFPQFKARVADAVERTPTDSKARGDGAHLTQYEGASDGELEAAWAALCARPTVHDPIPWP